MFHCERGLCTMPGVFYGVNRPFGGTHLAENGEQLQTTALTELHIELGAKMVPFAGYQMPVQYPLGVLKEHLHTRQSAGLFDVSHMGQIRLSGKGVAEALEALLPIDVVGLPVGQQRYALMTNPAGGVRDDLMVTNCGDSYLLVVNAACKDADLSYLREQLPAGIAVEVLADRALLALQGPQARAVMSRLCDGAAQMVFMQASSLSVAGVGCYVSCSGYTGEDGFEISVANGDAQALAMALLAEPEVEVIGLGARDSLRLEAGLCLYGHDLDSETTAIEASLLWSISKVRRPGGLREGGYPGCEVIAEQLQQGSERHRLMLQPQGRAPVREGAVIVNCGGEHIGRVCSGGFGPTIGGPVAMAYIQAGYVHEGDIYALVRNKQVPLGRVKGSLLPSRYFRG